MVRSPRATLTSAVTNPRSLDLAALIVVISAACSAGFLMTRVGQLAALDQQVRQLESFGVAITDGAYQQLAVRAGSACGQRGAHRHRLADTLAIGRGVSCIGSARRADEGRADVLASADSGRACFSHTCRARPHPLRSTTRASRWEGRRASGASCRDLANPHFPRACSAPWTSSSCGGSCSSRLYWDSVSDAHAADCAMAVWRIRGRRRGGRVDPGFTRRRLVVPKQEDCRRRAGSGPDCVGRRICVVVATLYRAPVTVETSVRETSRPSCRHRARSSRNGS